MLPSSLQLFGAKICELVPALNPQLLLALTVMVPGAVVLEPQVTSILLAPCKLVMAPLEEVHV